MNLHNLLELPRVHLRWRLFSRIPHLAVAALHEPLLEIDRVRDERICGEGVGWQGQRFECGVEVGDAVLREETDEVEPADGVFARRGREGAGVVVVERLQLGEVAVEGGDVACADRPDGADFEDFACSTRRVVV